MSCTQARRSVSENLKVTESTACLRSRNMLSMTELSGVVNAHVRVCVCVCVHAYKLVTREQSTEESRGQMLNGHVSI